MSTKNNLFSEIVLDVKNSDYEFNRFDKLLLRGIVSVRKLRVNAETYSSWKGGSAIVFNIISEMFSPAGSNIYCFIVSPCWKKDTKTSRYYGLGRALVKDFGADSLDFLFEKEVINDNDIIFYGIVKLTHENVRNICDLLSINENGVMFSSQGSEKADFSSLVEELAMMIDVKPKSQTFNLNIVEAINLILGKGSAALFPYAWEETGEYYLDIFGTQIAKTESMGSDSIDFN